MEVVKHDVPKWIKDNQQFFLPPVCNKLMHGTDGKGQLKVFFVGGPNQRKDFHLEKGEEFFYMLKGDMVLVVQEHGVFKNIHIKEGEVFLLPGCIPHSPQRFTNTVGLVIERERQPHELDCLRYFIPESTDILFERWFYCDDLGTQLGPVIKEYFASEEHRTKKPGPNSINHTPPYLPDDKCSLQKPFPLKEWLNSNDSRLKTNGKLPLFTGDYQSDIYILSAGTNSTRHNHAETWLWQLKGTSTIKVNATYETLTENSSLLIPSDASYSVTQSEDCYTLSVVMDPTAKHSSFFL